MLRTMLGAALGEWEASGRSVRRLVHLTLSTGMGGAFLVDRQKFRGAGGAPPGNGE